MRYKHIRRLCSLALVLAAVAALAPASALASPVRDVGGSSPQARVIVRTDRTIVREKTDELPIVLSGAALLIALGGAGYALVRTRAPQSGLTR